MIVKARGMEKVIKSTDWWDGPKQGLAYYNGQVCIYERVFDDELDDYTDEYDLVPISEEEKDCILNECKRLDNDLKNMGLESYQKKYLADKKAGWVFSATRIFKEKSSSETIRKKAKFTGFYEKGLYDENAYVEWSD